MASLLRYNRDSLSQYLVASSYDTDRKLYYNEQDKSAGILLELPAMPNTSAAFLDAMETWLSSSWPKNTIVQIMMYGDPNIESFWHNYMSKRGKKHDDAILFNPFRELTWTWAESHANFLYEKRASGIDKLDCPAPFRNFRVFISVKIPCPVEDFQSRKPDISALQEYRDALISALAAQQIFATHVLPDNFIRLMYQILNPNHPYPLPLYAGENLRSKEPVPGRKYVGWDQDLEIRDQMIESDTVATRSMLHARLDGWFVKAKTIKKMPAYPTEIDMNLLIGDIERANRSQITTPFLLTLTLDMNDQRSMILKKSSMILKQGAAMATLAPGLLNRQEECKTALERLEKNEKFPSGMWSLILFGRTKSDLEHASKTVDAFWSKEGYVLQNESWLHLPLLLFSTPFGATTEKFTLAKRGRPAPIRSFATLAPVQADGDYFGGLPAIPLISRRGQLFTLDLWSTSENYNGYVVAPSGSGKSFFMNFVIMNYLSLGGQVYLIDVGRSYEKICKRLGGQYIAFTNESKVQLNIFSKMTYEIWNDKSQNERKDELLGFCEQVLYDMTLIDDNEDLKTKKSLLQRILKDVFSAITPNKTIGPDQIRNQLLLEQKRVDNEEKSGDAIARYMADRLSPYCSSGRFSQWFSDGFTLDFDSPFVILELEELKSMGEMKHLVLSLIMTAIERKIYLTKDRSQKKLVVLEEAWDLLDGPSSASFIEHGYRRIRKYGGSFIVVTQGLLDFKHKNPAVGNVVMTNSSWKFLLQPKAEQIDVAIEDKLIAVNDYIKSIMLTAHTDMGKYSEVCFFNDQNTFGLGRLHVSPQTQLLFTTDPREVAFLEVLEAEGLSVWEAVEHALPLIPALRSGASIPELLMAAPVPTREAPRPESNICQLCGNIMQHSVQSAHDIYTS